MTESAPIPRKWKWAAILVVVLIIGWSVLSYFWLGPMIFQQNRQAAEKIVESEMDASSAINNYEWFKQQKQDIEAKRKQINNTLAALDQFHKNHPGDSSEWSRQARTRHSRLHTQLLGQQNMHNELVAKYNARSNMQNRNVFKGKLPYEMQKKFWTGDAR